MIYDLLYPWQKTIIETKKEMPSLGLFLDMGLGKTPISLAFAEMKKAENVLIVTIAPKRWESETLEGSWLWWVKKSETLSSAHVVLTNYESTYSHKKEDKDRRRGSNFVFKDDVKQFIMQSRTKRSVIILDESHKIKNLQSNNYRALKGIQRQTQNLVGSYCLTGSPFAHGYIECLTQLQFLGCSMTKGQFVDQFCVRGNNPGLLGWQQPIVGYKNETDILRLIHKFAITLESDEVISLPEKIFTNIYCRHTSDYDRFTKESLIRGKPNFEYRNLGGYFADTPGLYYLRTRELMSGFLGNGEKYTNFDNPRIEKLRDILENEPNNYVIFYNFTPELYQIYNLCKELDYDIDVYCGEIKSEYFYEHYSGEPGKRVIIANFASGSAGKNWQKYDHCVLYSTPFYKDYSQAIKRIHRIGSKVDCFYYCLIMENSLDNRMWKAIENCQEYTDKMFEYDFMRIQS